jgi:hypothetical protein
MGLPAFNPTNAIKFSVEGLQNLAPSIRATITDQMGLTILAERLVEHALGRALKSGEKLSAVQLASGREAFHGWPSDWDKTGAVVLAYVFVRIGAVLVGALPARPEWERRVYVAQNSCSL